MTILTGGDSLPVALTDDARRRLSNQIARAYRGTYGAQTGLRTLGQSIARRMIDAGWSPEAVSAALARVVLDHPASTSSDRRARAMGEPDTIALVEVTRQSVADIVLEQSD